MFSMVNFFQVLGLNQNSKRKVSSKKKKHVKSNQNSSLEKPGKAVGASVTAGNYEDSYPFDEIQSELNFLLSTFKSTD